VARSQGLSIEGADLENLAELKLNEREIKNIMKIAHLLAIGRKEMIRIDHIRSMLENKTLDEASRE